MPFLKQMLNTLFKLMRPKQHISNFQPVSLQVETLSCFLLFLFCVFSVNIWVVFGRSSFLQQPENGYQVN